MYKWCSRKPEWVASDKKGSENIQSGHRLSCDDAVAAVVILVLLINWYLHLRLFRGDGCRGEGSKSEERIHGCGEQSSDLRCLKLESLERSLEGLLCIGEHWSAGIYSFQQAWIRTITGDCEADNRHKMQCSSRKIDWTVDMTTGEGIAIVYRTRWALTGINLAAWGK